MHDPWRTWLRMWASVLLLLGAVAEFGCAGPCLVRGSQCRAAGDCQGASACVCGRCLNDLPCPPQVRPQCSISRPCPGGSTCDCGRCVVQSAPDAGEPPADPPPADPPPEPRGQGSLVLGVLFLEAQKAAVEKLQATLQRDDGATVHQLSLDKEGGELWDSPRWRSIPLALPAGRELRLTLEAFDAAGKRLAAHVLGGISVGPRQHAAVISVMRLPSAGENQAPEIVGLFLSSTAATPKQPLKLSVLARDAANDRLRYRWQGIEPQGAFLATDRSDATWSWPKGFQGKRVRWSVHVEDHRAGKAGLILTLPVDEKSQPFQFEALPHVDHFRASRTRLEAGGGTELQVYALSNGPQARLSYRWHFPQDSCPGTLTGAGPAVDWQASAAGLSKSCQVTVTISDGRNQQLSSLQLKPAQSQWSHLPATHAVSEVLSVLVGDKGHLFVRGRFEARIEWDGRLYEAPGPFAESFILKLDPQGNALWLWHTQSKGEHSIHHMSLDAKGDLYLVGSFAKRLTVGSHTLESKGETDIFLMKLSGAGEVLHAIGAGGPSRDMAHAVVVDAQGQVYVAGGFGQGATFRTQAMKEAITPAFRNRSDIFIAKLDQLSAKGSWQWVREAGAGFSFAYEAATHLAFGEKGQLLAVGVFAGEAHFGPFKAKTSASQSLFVARLSTEGQWLGLDAVDGQGNIRPQSIAVDTRHQLFILGQFDIALKAQTVALTANRDAGNSNLFLLGLDPGRRWKWGVSLADRLQTTGRSLVLGPQEHLYLTGETMDSAALWKDRLEPKDRKVAFLASLTREGKWRWTRPALELDPGRKVLQFNGLAVLGAHEFILGGVHFNGFSFEQSSFKTASPTVVMTSFLLRISVGP